MSTPRTVVVGAGRMGTGIAHALLLAGAEVVLVDSSADFVDRGLERVRAMVAKSAERGSLDISADEMTARLEGGVGAEQAAGARLAIEAVPEDPELKVRILTQLEQGLPANAVLATNTSSISIDELASALSRPGQFLGMHFFNPVPASTLVEVVRGAKTSDGAVGAAREWTSAMGKTAIVVKDSPGFASSRLGVAIGLEAIRMVEEGVASAGDIDQAMVLGYKFPVGPLRLTDMVGLDVRLGIAEYLYKHLGPRFEPPALMREMVSGGDLGQKSGRGFYDWSI
jgi:3-hydroxybutyryl-CoA dehydrogenase